MQGFDAITAQNGWAMAATGACIVITGLVVLSFFISQLHRILGLFEKNGTKAPEIPEKRPVAAPAAEAAATDPLSDLAATANKYRNLTLHLGETFGLVQLYQTLEVAQDPHPHITVRELKANGYLAAADEGNFSWTDV